MVDFNTRIFSEDDGRIIGAEITVLSTTGDHLGSISVADAETLAEMQAQLAVIDETYFTEERLEEILANISEGTAINATRLNGFQSSDFAKTSQLSNYAPVSHNHSVSQITELYDYQITANQYNVNIDSTVTITVKVTNRATGQPVVGVSVPVLKNNASWSTGRTGVNGTFSLSYTADTWGLVTFSANNSNTQINVSGWKQYYNDTNYTVQYNNEFVNITVHTGSATVSTSWNEWHNVLNDSSLRPSMPVSTTSATGNVIIKCNDNSAKVSFKSNTGSTVTEYIYGELLWKKQ